MAAKTPRCGQESAYMSPPSVGPPPTTPPPVGAASSARERELSSPPTARRLHSDRRRAAGEGGGYPHRRCPHRGDPSKSPRTPGGDRLRLRPSTRHRHRHRHCGPSIPGRRAMWRHAARRSSAQIRRSGVMSSSSSPAAPAAAAGAAVPGPCIVHKRGTDILHDPWFNKVPDLAICMPRSRALGLSRFRFWHTAGHGVPHDGAGSPWPPRPPPAAGHVVRAAVRPLQ